jgi:dipeptidase
MCDSVVATGPNTASGTTLFAKNSDRPASECQPFVQLPAARHPRGAMLACTHIEIPQVPETYRVMGHSPWWVWGFEHGVNENAVAIGNQSVFSKEPVEEQAGLIGMDLVRLGLERGRDAREALEVIASLIERHGQGGSAFGPGKPGYHNSFLVADPASAWLLETSNRHWAARRVDLDGVSNHLTLGSNWDIGSRDLEAYARGEGWWQGRARLDIASAYRNPHVPGRISEGRLRRSRELLEAGRGKHDAQRMQSLLRDHGTPGLAPPRGASLEDEAYFSLCMHSEPVGTTTASLVAPLPAERSAAWAVWVSFGSPCLGVFVPVYMDGVIPAVLAAGGEQDVGAARPSLWWSLHRLHDAAARDLARNLPRVREAWRSIEEWIESGRLALEADCRALHARGERSEAAQRVTAFMERVAQRVLEHADSLAAELAAA